jgi:hypothetical protein
MKLAKSRAPDQHVQIVAELGERRNNLEIGIVIMMPFKIFFADGCAATATWPNTTTGTEQVNSEQVNSEQVNSEQVNSEQVNSEQVNSEQVNSDNQ